MYGFQQIDTSTILAPFCWSEKVYLSRTRSPS
nr:MAG TPA: hypothetical protein [Caudoviricetes sp.]